MANTLANLWILTFHDLKEFEYLDATKIILTFI